MDTNLLSSHLGSYHTSECSRPRPQQHNATNAGQQQQHVHRKATKQKNRKMAVAATAIPRPTE